MPNKYAPIIERITNPSSTPERAPLTGEQLREFQDRQGYAIATNYLEFVRDYGGAPASAISALKDDRKKEGTISMFFDVPSSAEQLDWPRNTFEVEWAPTLRQILGLSEEVLDVDTPPRELLAIATDMGGNQVHLCLSGEYVGFVFFWMNWDEIYFAANSFDEFMQSLQLWK